MVARSSLELGRATFASLEYTRAGAPGLGLTEGLTEGDAELEADGLADRDTEEDLELDEL